MSVNLLQNHRLQSRRQGGMALVIVLLVVALLTSTVIFYFLFVRLQRQLSSSSAGQAKADVLAQSAVDTIVGDLRNEISAGSTVNTSTTTPAVSIYSPSSKLNAVPYRVGDQSFPNVLKKSAASTKFWGTGSQYSAALPNPIRAAASNSTTQPSEEGRYIDKNQWNKPFLLSSSVNAPANFVAPDWVVITRNGAINDATNSMPTLATLGNRADQTNYAVGRFAYMVYDEGGLIDINVAGHPDGMPADFQRKRGLLAQMDLNSVPGITDGGALVKWRNAQTGASSSSYSNFVHLPGIGFATVQSGDQKLVGRQDLINYVKGHSDQITTDALPFLGTFTREVNGPSYDPQIAKPAGVDSIDHTFNPSLIDTRVTQAFTRYDNTAAVVGDPLIVRRFPLSRLTLLDVGSDTASISKYFNLTRTGLNVPWSYANSTIKKLSEVASLGREPDFFELLQAAILQGSLGKTSGNTRAEVDILDNNTSAQIIQIGVNIIDQYGSAKYPTRISFNGREYSGRKNLPYLTRGIRFVYRPLPGQGGWCGNVPYYTAGTGLGYYQRPWVGMWLMGEVWNPYIASAATVDSISLRFVISGGFSTYVKNDGVAPTYPSVPHANPIQFPAQPTDPTDPNDPSTGIRFTSSAIFSEPTILSGTCGANATGNNWIERASGGTPSQGLMGIFISGHNAPDKRIENNPTLPIISDSNFTPGGKDVYYPQDEPLHYLLQYKNATGVWVTYDDIRNVTNDSAQGPIGFDYWRATCAFCCDIRSDPTSDRFGIALQRDYTGNTNIAANSDGTPAHYWIRPGTGPGIFELDGVFGGSGWSDSAGYYAGALSDNKAGSVTFYTDNDGVQRQGDGSYTQSSGLEGLPLATGNYPSRPVMLNRPFTSVADLGYVGRGMPWKHLDLFTDKSADSALLDLFSVNNDPAIIAGRINPNTRSREVLAALIATAGLSERDSSTVGAATSTATLALADQIIAITSDQTAGPLINRAELVTRVAGSTTLTYGNSTDDHIKVRREAVVRALADSSNTRTWNLLIDVVVQSGNYPPAAKDLTHFRVTGNKRYWVHVAIDRYTNKVIDQSWEAVHD